MGLGTIPEQDRRWQIAVGKGENGAIGLRKSEEQNFCFVKEFDITRRFVSLSKENGTRVRMCVGENQCTDDQWACTTQRKLCERCLVSEASGIGRDAKRPPTTMCRCTDDQ